MFKGKIIGVIVPAYNERELIGETLSGIPDYVDAIYVIDDCSTDDTFEIIKEYQIADERINLIRHQINGGVGAAIITGYKKALDDGIEIMSVMAGDNQMDPDELPKLLNPVAEGRADYAKGNRLYGSDSRKGMSNWRSFGNNLLTLLTKLSSGYWRISDPQNGYTAISRHVFEKFPPDSIFPWYGYCNDLLVRLNVFDFRVVDVSIPARYGREKSKIRYGKYIPIVSWLLLKDFFWRLVTKYIRVDFNPLVIVCFLGIALASCGFLKILWSIFSPGSMLSSLLVFITGVLLMLSFIYLEMNLETKANFSITINKSIDYDADISLRS